MTGMQGYAHPAAMVRWIILALLALAGCGEPPPAPLVKPPAGALRIATFNVHYIVTARQTGAWSMGDWDRRKGAVDAAVKAIDPDIIAFQEMESFSGGSIAPVNHQLDWLLSRNPDLSAAATGDPAVFPSTQPILYRAARFRALDQGWFFFSETPDTLYARTFNGSYPAFAVWALFEERQTGRRFRVYNVHFDYASRSNRLRSAALVAQRAQAPIAAGETVFVVGDLNAGLSSRTAGLLREAGVAFAPVRGATWHWNRGLDITGPVDHIAATPGAERVGDVRVLRRRFGGEWPSDHYPVVADYLLP